MDNRITKTRLSDFLSYEWILMIIITVIAIIVWEFAYTVGAVRLTTGQHFKYYYDVSIDSSSNGTFQNLLLKEKTFSYDILKMESESLNNEYNVLSVRLSIQEGDILITDKKVAYKKDSDGIIEKDEYGNFIQNDKKSVRAKSNIDNYAIYSLDKLNSDAQKYLAKFLKNGLDIYGADNKIDVQKLPAVIFDWNNYDQAKIKSYFLKRMDGDNRFRKDDEKASGVKKEIARIKDLVEEVKYFNAFLTFANDNPELDLLYNYTKHEQSYNLGDNETKSSYQNSLLKGDYAVSNMTDQENADAEEQFKTKNDKTELTEKEKVKAHKEFMMQKYFAEKVTAYGINVGSLDNFDGFSGQKAKDASEYFRVSSFDEKAEENKISGRDKASDVVMMAFNFYSYQPHLQFETISFMNTVIKTCSNFTVI